MSALYGICEVDSAACRAALNRRAARAWTRALVAAAVVAAAGCGDSPTSPSPPPPAPPGAPTVTCPADVTLQSPDGQPVPYTVTPPPAQGGAPPVVVTCNAPATFPVGTTTVTCTATDARQQQGSCSFAVIVQGPPVLGATRFLAFGDSLTAGEVSFAAAFRLVMPQFAYPTRLATQLLTRYPKQAITVENVGVPGELATVGGVARLPRELSERLPEVLLLMEGTNDLLSRSPDRVAVALEDMVRDAKQRNVRVFLATLPPAGSGKRPAQAEAIRALNPMIKDIAARQNVHLVDVYAPLAADMSLIGQDDLHPTPQGYDVMARTWFDAIVAALDSPAAAGARAARRR